MKHNLLIKVICASLLVAFIYTNAGAQGTIYTIAGTGVAGFGGDGGPAALAVLSDPSGVAVDGSGNIYIADHSNYCIRKISAAGVMSTVAGTGGFGYAGMGGPAISAGMEYPNSVFADAAGDYYVTDFYADCAYGISAGTGILSNICGHNSQGCDGDGGDAPLARMELPKQIWKDHVGNFYIADYGNNRVRRIDGVTNVVTTVSGPVHGFSPDGTPAAICQWGSITGICADMYGNVYVSDAINHVVRMIDATTGNVRTIAGNGASGYSGDGGAALSATMRTPATLFVNSAGYLFICDPASNVVRVMNVFVPSGIIKTLAGNGTMGFSGDGHLATTAQLNQPSGVWEDASGKIYIADMGNQRIRAIVRSGYKADETGISANTMSDVNIFPNPSNGAFTVIGTSLADNTTLEVYNMMGEKVLTQDVKQQHTTVTLDQPAGLYNVVLKSANAVSNHQIVISK